MTMPDVSERSLESVEAAVKSESAKAAYQSALASALGVDTAAVEILSVTLRRRGGRRLAEGPRIDVNYRVELPGGDEAAKDAKMSAMSNFGKGETEDFGTFETALTTSFRKSGDQWLSAMGMNIRQKGIVTAAPPVEDMKVRTVEKPPDEALEVDLTEATIQRDPRSDQIAALKQSWRSGPAPPPPSREFRIRSSNGFKTSSTFFVCVATLLFL